MVSLSLAYRVGVCGILLAFECYSADCRFFRSRRVLQLQAIKISIQAWECLSHLEQHIDSKGVLSSRTLLACMCLCGISQSRVSAHRSLPFGAFFSAHRKAPLGIGSRKLRKSVHPLLFKSSLLDDQNIDRARFRLS